MYVCATLHDCSGVIRGSGRRVYMHIYMYMYNMYM